MSILNLQVALVRLYLDPEAREMLRNGDRSPLVEFGLTQAETQDLQRLVIEWSAEVELFADTLRHKRQEKIRSFYPLLSACIRPDKWNWLCAKYCAKEPIRAVVTDAEDSLRFGRFLLEEKEQNEVDNDALMDILILESTKAVITNAPFQHPSMTSSIAAKPEDSRPFLIPPACLCTIRRDPDRLRSWVNAGALQPLEPDSAPVHLLFFRRDGGTSSVGLARIGYWLASLLSRADGKSTLAEIINVLTISPQPDLVQQAAWQSLTALAAEGIVGFVCAKGQLQ